MYASMFPHEVVGMVLVDASHPDQENRFPPELKNLEGTWNREAEFMAYTMPFGVPRLLGLCDSDPTSRAADCNARASREQLAEMKAFRESAAETAAAGSLGYLPVAVLSHDPDRPSSDLPPEIAKPTNEAWERMQEELAHLSTRGTQTIAKNSAHYIQIDRPDVVVDAVRNTVAQARQGRSTP
jgi:pimeloyl-ACP methyl ester carboxylesterase